MMNRRQFLASATAGAACVSLGWPRRAAWAAPDAPRESLRLVFFTDIHTRVEWDTPEALGLAADQINAQRGDLVICGGDCITDGFQSTRAAVEHRWHTYREHLHDRLQPAAVAVVGNHDLVGAMPQGGEPPEPDPRAAFREALGVTHTYRSFDAGGYHVILLDSVEITRDELKYRGHIDAAQLAWLKGDLAAVDPATPIVLVTHMPLLTSFYQATEGQEKPAPRNRVVVNNRDVLAAFEGHRLHLVLQGHLHVNELLRWRDTTFITGGAVCGKWWRGAWHGTEEGFGVVTLRPDRVEWEYVDLGWSARRP